MSVPILLPEAHGRAAKHWLSFHYADELIVVERAPKARQVPRLLIKVDPDCRVSVQAPASANDEEVLQALKNVAVGFTSSCVSSEKTQRT